MALDKTQQAPTFFSRPAWAISLSNSYPNMRPEPYAVTVENVQLVVPLVRIVSRLPWRIYSGTPLGGYSTITTAQGLVSDPGLIAKCLTLLAQTKIDSIEINSWPFAPVCPETDDRYALHETSVIDLQSGADVALSLMSGNSRRMAGQAERRGVECKREAGTDAVNIYYNLLADSANRWGLVGPKIPKKFIEALSHFGGDDVEIWIARHEGEAIGGMVALYGSHEVSVWSAAMRGDMAVLRPHNVLNVALIRAAADRGVRWYNLGSSEGLPGVKRFKEGLGAKTFHYRTYGQKSPVYTLYSRIRSSLAKAT